MTSAYDRDRLAAAYAFDRPPVHEQFQVTVIITGYVAAITRAAS
jgi:hypothetical protein